MGARTKPEHIAWNRDLVTVLLAIVRLQRDASDVDGGLEAPSTREIQKVAALFGVEPRRTRQLIDALLVTGWIARAGTTHVRVYNPGTGHFAMREANTYVTRDRAIIDRADEIFGQYHRGAKKGSDEDE